MLDHAMVVYDAFYTWCTGHQHETHNWTPRTGRGMSQVRR